MLVLVYEEFRADNQGTVRSVLRFLGADEDQPIAQIDTRPLPEVRSGLLHRVTAEMRRARKNPAAAGRLARAADAALPDRLRGRTLKAGWRRAVYTQPRPPTAARCWRCAGASSPRCGPRASPGRDLVSLWGYEHID